MSNNNGLVEPYTKTANSPQRPPLYNSYFLVDSQHRLLFKPLDKFHLSDLW